MATAKTRPTTPRKRPRKRRAYSSPACLMEEFEHEQALSGEPDVRIKRIYEPRERSDGFRVLVDRIWPRGVRKEGAAIDCWARELAPSTALRKWFGHDPARWPQFRTRYRAELRSHEAELQALRARATRQRVTLLYSARDTKMNQAAVLQEAIRKA